MPIGLYKNRATFISQLTSGRKFLTFINQIELAGSNRDKLLATTPR